MSTQKIGKPLKAGIWYTISNFLVKGMTFLTMPIFTRFMESDEIGSFSNIQSWFNILAIITTMELYSSVSLAQFDYKDEMDEYISSNLVFGSVITTIFYGIILIFSDFFQMLFDMDLQTINLLFIYLLVYPAVQMFQIYNQIKYEYIPTIIVSFGSSLLSTIVSLTAAIFCSNALKGRIYGNYIPLIICSAIVYVYLLKKGKKISKKYWKYSLKISFPLIWHLLAANILNSSDRIMINKYIGSAENALYTVSYSCAMLVALLWSSMNSAWSPWAYQKMDKKEYGELKQKSKAYTLFFICAVSAFMLVSPEILYIMGGKSYMESIYVIPPVMVGYVFQFIYSLYVNIEFYFKKQKNIAVGTIVAAIVNILLNMIFIPKFGYIAAAYTTMIGYAFLFLIHFIIVKNMGKSYWYDTKFMLCIIGSSVILMFISNWLYSHNICRISIILVAFIILVFIIIKKWKEVYNFIKTMVNKK